MRRRTSFFCCSLFSSSICDLNSFCKSLNSFSRVWRERERASDPRMFGFLWCKGYACTEKLLTFSVHLISHCKQSWKKCVLFFSHRKNLHFQRNKTPKLIKIHFYANVVTFLMFFLQSLRPNWLFRGKSWRENTFLQTTQMPNELSQHTHTKCSVQIHWKFTKAFTVNKRPGRRCVPNRYDFGWFVLLSVCTSSLIK